VGGATKSEHVKRRGGREQSERKRAGNQLLNHTKYLIQTDFKMIKLKRITVDGEKIYA
jgi:hypothetical protein